MFDRTVPMIIDHPKRDEVLIELTRQCVTGGMHIYLIELVVDQDRGWDATFKATSGRQTEHELRFCEL